MTNETVTKSGRFYCVSVTPDICKTPVGASTPPLPYTIVGEFSDASGASPNVKSHSEPVVLHGKTTIPTVKGDAPGTAGGVKSGTVGEQVDTKASSATHHANGANLVQVGREVWMNARNTVGKIYERGGESARPLLAALSNKVDEARESLKPAALAYKEHYSAPMHATGETLMEAGGKIAAAGAVTAGAGAVATATVVGAEAGIPMMAVGGGMTQAGATMVSGGTAIDTAATVFDHASDYVLTGKAPDVMGAVVNAATNLAESVVLNKLGPAGRWLGSKFNGVGGKTVKKLEPAKKPHPAKTPAEPPSKPPAAHDDDGKSRGKKQPKSEPPSECCPKNKAPAGKPVNSKKPVHFGTGQEVLHQTDFVTTGATPRDWTRCYRSGAETEDGGLLGARWSTAFTTSVALAPDGCVYVDETGRALRLPALAQGASHDELKEGFVLQREDADSFSLTWRDGSRDTFTRGAEGFLPHGYDGVNAMLDPGAPLRVERFVLTRSAARDGRGVSVALWLDALPGELLLRVTHDDGVVIEAMREEAPARGNDNDLPATARIGRVEEVLEDGTRICHARYRYGPDPAGGRCHNLVSQANVLGDARTYTYRHHLLTACTSYTGFAQVIEWISLAALRARWSGSTLDDVELAATYPITRETSYQARAVASRAADGSEGAGVALSYLDIDTTRVSENGDVLDYTFDHNWLVTCVSRVTDGASKRLGTREWDRNGMLLAETDGMGRSTRFAYDVAGNLISSTDAAGHTTHIAYDEANQAVGITDAMGHVSTRSYDAAGRLASVTNALGHATSYRYDDKGRLTEQTDAKGGVSRFEYDKAGQLRTSTDCSVQTTKYYYDERGRIAAVVPAEAAAGEQTRYAYDALGRLITLTRPDGTSEHYAYDGDGNLLVHTDALGHQTRYRYNGQGLPVERIDAIGQSVRYRYDNALRLVELANAKDERYVLIYNADGALTSEIGFDGKITNYTYDAAGQLTASECAGQRTDLVRDCRGLLIAKMNAEGIVRFAYDELGRMVAVAAPHAEHRFAYDALGQLIEERAGYYITAPQAVPAVDGSRVPDAAFVMTHAYDELGNRIRTTLPNGRRVDTLRYGSGHWHGTLWQGKSIIDVENDGQYRERKRQLGRGSADQRLLATREYDPQSRVSRMTLARVADGSNAMPMRDCAFKYDPVGNLLTISHGGNLHDYTLGTFRYAYDPLGQLVSAVQPGLTETFVFDSAGNLLDLGSASRTAMSTLPVITGNLLKDLDGHSYRYDEKGNVIVKHSAAGALSTGSPESNLALAYDADNRLVRTVRTGHLLRQSADYFYDAFSRRVAKRIIAEKWRNTEQPERDVPFSTTTTTTLFVWDGDVLSQELSLGDTFTYLYEPESFVPMARIISRERCENFTPRQGALPQVTAPVSGKYIDTTTVPAGNETKAHQVHFWQIRQWTLSREVSVAELVAMEDASDSAEEAHQALWNSRQAKAVLSAPNDHIDYYNCDHLGTPRELLDEAGFIVWETKAKAWGRLLMRDNLAATDFSVNPKLQPLRYQGQYEDAETGLFYNRYRYYDPESSRYTVSDPISLSGGINAYSYASNPTGWIDPLGLAKSTCRLHLACDPCERLPQNIKDTFTGSKSTGRTLLQDETFYKYHGDNNRVGRKYSWLTRKTYNTETGLRRALAIRVDWGVNITKISTFRVPAGTVVCEGKAATQGVGYPGKGYQAVITNIPRSWISKTENVF